MHAMERNERHGMTDADKKNFFISYAYSDRAWAEWIAWQLERADYSTFQAGDFVVGQNLIHQVRQALVHCERVIAVLTPRYLTSSFAEQEWMAAFEKDPTGATGFLLPIRVEECALTGLLAQIVYIDLVGLNEAEARERLLLSLRMAQRAKTSSLPKFPRTDRTPGAEVSFPQVMPSFWNLPTRDSFFTDREELLEKMHECFASAPTTAQVAQVLTGLGGSGKTSLAIEYAYRLRSKYKLAWLLNAESQASLLAGFASLTHVLSLPEKILEKKGFVIDVLYQALEGNSPWLLIFDEASEPELLQPFLRRSTGGHILVTSRNPRWCNVAQSWEVNVWTRRISTIFLMEHTGDTDPVGAEMVADACGDLPLALKYAVGYCSSTKTTLRKYLELLKNSFEGRRAQISFSVDLGLSRL